MYTEDIKLLLGKTFSSVKRINDSEIHFCDGDNTIIMGHLQDCCECVYIEDICGVLSDLENTPILEAYSSTKDDEAAYETGMWTFYHIATINGYVTIRWYGESNGYYSVDVSIYNKRDRW